MDRIMDHVKTAWAKISGTLSGGPYASGRNVGETKKIFLNSPCRPFAECDPTLFPDGRGRKHLGLQCGAGEESVAAVSADKFLSGDYFEFAKEDPKSALAERLTLSHVVYEPIAQTLRSFLSTNSSSSFDAQGFIDEILGYDTRHTGGELPATRDLWQTTSPEIRRKILESVRRHHLFITNSIRRAFSKYKGADALLLELLGQFDNSVNLALGDLPQ